MNEFTYQNIFETKGIEYLVIIGFLLILVPFWILVNKRSRIKQQLKENLGIFTAAVLNIPGGLFYSKFHSWAHLGTSGIARMGIDDFLLKAVGPVKFVPLIKNGKEVKKGEIIGNISQNEKFLPVRSPITGKVEDVNQTILDEPSLLYDDPYKNGWLFSIKPANWKEETQGYYLADEAIIWFREEVDRFKDFLAENFGKNAHSSLPVAYQEGGELRQNILSEMDASQWEAFQDEFIK